MKRFWTDFWWLVVIFGYGLSNAFAAIRLSSHEDMEIRPLAQWAIANAILAFLVGAIYLVVCVMEKKAEDKERKNGGGSK